VRRFPALECTRATGATDETLERWLAAIDDARPQAVETIPGGVRVFFADSGDRDFAARLMEAVAPDVTCVPVDVPDDDWAERSQASLAPVHAGPFLIRAPWHDQRARGPGAAAREPVTLVILPSMGFGTGHHASTRLCLRLLADLQVRAARVLDVGTGSGILALAAWRLGARRVLAIDPDADALTAAGENLRLNGAVGAIELARSDLETLAADGREAFDIVLANLTGATLVRDVPSFDRLAADHATLVASGVQRNAGSAVVGAFGDRGWRVRQIVGEDEWLGVCLTRGEPIPSVPTGR